MAPVGSCAATNRGGARDGKTRRELYQVMVLSPAYEEAILRDSAVKAASAPAGRRLTTARAIAEGIAQEMDRDPGVFVLGEDIGKYGGIFGATGGLLDQLGPRRVLDKPISETAFIGLGIGAAVEGMRPVVERRTSG